MNQQLKEIKSALAAATPGPWEVWERQDGVQVIQKDGEWSICDMDGGDWQMWLNNSRLIASAPQWLESLVSQVEEMQLKLIDVRDLMDAGFEDSAYQIVNEILQSLKGGEQENE